MLQRKCVEIVVQCTEKANSGVNNEQSQVYSVSLWVGAVASFVLFVLNTNCLCDFLVLLLWGILMAAYALTFTLL